MNHLNVLTLEGNLTANPELRYTPSGTPVCNFRMASNETRGTGENRKQSTVFIDVAIFGKQAENCGQYLAKGRAVIVVGKLQQQNWETDQGEKRSKLEIIAHNVLFRGPHEQAQDEADQDEDPS